MVNENCQNLFQKRSISTIIDPQPFQIPTDEKCSRKSFQCVSLLYFNARSLANKFDIFKALLKTQNYDIIFISETWLKSWHATSSIIDTSNFTMYRTDRNDKRGGGVGIVVKKHLAPFINLIS